MKKRWMIVLALTMLIVFVELAYLSVARYRAYNAGMQDLGNMTQAIWSATRGKPLIFTSSHGQWSRLSLHVELVYFLLAPLYAVFPSPITLLIVQVLLFVVAAVPLYRLAARHFEIAGVALVFVWIYLLYPVAQTAVLFDIHGDTLAMPLLIFALEALDRRAWRGYAVWLILALCCKFYVAVPVAALGVVLLAKGDRRIGAHTFLAGVGWAFLAYAVIRPTFAPPVDIAPEQVTALGYLEFYFGELLDSMDASWPARVVSAVIVFLPVAWPLFRATWWWIPTLAIGIPALLSSGPGPSYHYAYHHYALVVPFAVVGSVYGIVEMRNSYAGWRTRRGRFLSWPLALGVMMLFTVILNSFYVDTPLNPKFWNPENGALADSMLYARTARDAVKDQWVADHVPPQSPIAASSLIAPHVANRETLYVSSHLSENIDEVDYVVVDALFDYVQALGPSEFAGGVGYEWDVVAWMLKHPEFRLVHMRDGLLLLARNASQTDALDQTVERIPADVPARPMQTFGDDIALVEFRAQPVSDRVWCFTWCWLPLRSLQNTAARLAVSRLEGIEDARFVHLPTIALVPTPSWEEGYKVCERFDVMVSQEVPSGDYGLLVGWYDSSHPAAGATDERSRLGEEQWVATITLP